MLPCGKIYGNIYWKSDKATINYHYLLDAVTKIYSKYVTRTSCTKRSVICSSKPFYPKCKVFYSPFY